MGPCHARAAALAVTYNPRRERWLAAALTRAPTRHESAQSEGFVETMDASSKLQISEQQLGGVCVLTLSGEITVDDGDLAFRRCVNQVLAAGQRKIIVDLGNVTYIDSAGVGMIVAGSKSVQQHGGAMRLARLTARSHHLLAMLKLKFVCEIFDDVEAAARSFAWRPQ